MNQRINLLESTISDTQLLFVILTFDQRSLYFRGMGSGGDEIAVTLRGTLQHILINLVVSQYAFPESTGTRKWRIIMSELTRESNSENTSENESEPRRKDWWDKTKVMSGALLALLGIIIPLIYSREQDKKRDQESKSQRQTELFRIMSDREHYEMDFRAKTFEMLLEKILNGSSSIGERIATLRLFYQNFPDRFNPRVFFDALSTEARLKNNTSALDDLRSLAYEISKFEESRIEVATSHEFHSKWVPADSTVSFALPPLDHKSHPHNISIALRHVDPRNGSADVHVDFGHDLIDVPDQFQISYFDTPFTDYTSLPDGHRIAITLKDIDTGGSRPKIKIKVIEFPRHYSISGDRPEAEEINWRVDEGMGIKDTIEHEHNETLEEKDTTDEPHEHEHEEHKE